MGVGMMFIIILIICSFAIIVNIINLRIFLRLEREEENVAKRQKEILTLIGDMLSDMNEHMVYASTTGG